MYHSGYSQAKPYSASLGCTSSVKDTFMVVTLFFWGEKENYTQKKTHTKTTTTTSNNKET